MNIRLFPRAFAGAASLALILTGCSSFRDTTGYTADGAGVAPVWPPAPAPPRILFEGSYDGVEALGVKVGFWRRLVNLITSDDRGRELFVKPLAVSIDADDNLCLADHGAKKIFFFDRKSRRCRQWTRIGRQHLESPVAVVKHKDRFYVADTALKKIIGFDIKGRLMFEVSEECERPAGLAIYGDRLLVADSRLHRILCYGLNGRFLYWFGDRGTEPGQLNFPTHLAVGPDGNIYVTDSMNSRIQIFTESGVFVRAIGGPGSTSGSFNRPKGIALDADANIYVSDAIFDNVQIFDREGRFLLDFGAGGSEDGDFWMPSGIAIDSKGTIYVADSYNHRLQSFRIIDLEKSLVDEK